MRAHVVCGAVYNIQNLLYAVEDDARRNLRSCGAVTCP